MNEHFLSGLNVGFLEEIEGGIGANRERGGFLIAHTLRLCSDCRVFGQAFVLGVSAKVLLKSRSKNLVTDFEPLDIFADCFNFTG